MNESKAASPPDASSSSSSIPILNASSEPVVVPSELAPEKPPPPRCGRPGQDESLPVCPPPASENEALIAETAASSRTLALVPAPASPLKLVRHPELKIDRGLGQLELRTPEEERELQACEEDVRQAFQNFAKAGLALRRIRDGRLYKNEYHSFELYCRDRWGFGRNLMDRYIVAAQIWEALLAFPGMAMPECEWQIRPLVGLPPALALEAWIKAFALTRDGRVTGWHVKCAVKQLLDHEVQADSAKAAAAGAQRAKKSRLRQDAKVAFQELFSLVLAPGFDREEVLKKLEQLQRLLDPILNPRKKRGVTF